MSIKVGRGGGDFLYEFSSYTDGELILLNQNNDKISITTPLKLDPSFEEKEFDVYFLAKKDVKENDIFQVFIKEQDKRIGWLIPTNSISSNNHDYADNVFFLRYAYIGAIEALKQLDESFYSKPVDPDLESIPFSDIFHERTVLLIISKETLINSYDFDLDRAAPSLVKHGYFKLNAINPDEIEFYADAPQGNKVKLEQISECLTSHQLISEILNTSLAYEKKAIFKFFFIYQIIELLIDFIYQTEQDDLINELTRAKGDTGKAKEILEKMQEYMSERKRILLLVDKYTSVKDRLAQLMTLCNSLLGLLDREQANDFHKYFYSIRNFIFHQYRDFPKEGVDILEDIIKETIEILPNMLSTFNHLNNKILKS